MGNWYILRNNLQYGPYTTEQMLSMESQGQLYTNDGIVDGTTQQSLSLAQAQQQWHSFQTPGPGAYNPGAYNANPNPAQGMQYANSNPMSTKKRRKQKRILPKWAKRVRLGVACLVVALVLGFGVWKAGEVTGYWRERELANASSEWKKQAGFSKEESDIKACLTSFSDALEKKDLATAMTFVYAEEQQKIQDLLIKEDAKIPVLVEALKTMEISYLSTDSGNYAALRMATVTVGKIKTSSGTSSGFTIVMVKTEKGWVVSSL